MNPEFVFVIFNYSIIPFIAAIITTIFVSAGYRKLKLYSFFKHNKELIVSDIDKQIRSQANQIELLSDQHKIVNEKIKEMYEIIKLIEEKISTLDIEGMESPYFANPPKREYGDDLGDIVKQPNHDHISQNHVQETHYDERKNSTIEYILKRLEGASLTTREIQVLTGRTREHTSRLMKKLYEENFVSRDITTKPFKYTITDEGRKRLSRHSSSKIHSHSYLDNENRIGRLVRN
ncbi:hypothetical protein [Candidatus Nitrosocosmicus franklandus]|uniref:HTH marR-type domain-containing protein n=1 Tax=Candidatus Nitrosocosmicus franklandianus TaxID=1798806 RepID=A0A484IED7_9ARCH|nr:hypothetical protein [Candidatus Nitrosocosmicus franklandus]VFJ14012.1 conserved protein of unknown function [Candidatus Nitrosocosmicus franklandus]